jgi:hypothetical protein
LAFATPPENRHAYRFNIPDKQKILEQAAQGQNKISAFVTSSAGIFSIKSFKSERHLLSQESLFN